MGFRWLPAALAIGVACAGSLQADLKQARAEPNLEKRSQLAMDNAMAAYREARSEYEKGEAAHVAERIAEIQESVDVAFEALTGTGKDPRRSPKWFKKAEIETRDLLRKLDAFDHEMSFDERPALEKVKERVQKIHDELLLGLMEGKHK